MLHGLTFIYLIQAMFMNMAARENYISECSVFNINGFVAFYSQVFEINA